MKRRSAIIIASVVLVFGLVLGGVLWHFSNQILFPGVRCWEHYLICGDPSDLGLPFETVSLTTADGLHLPGWYIPAEKPQASIIFVHGHGGTIHEGLRYAPLLYRSGYNLLLFSLRRNLGNLGVGEVGPYYATMGCLERGDIRAAVDFLNQDKHQNAIGVFGFSMGAASAILAMAEDQRIRAGLFSGGYASISDELIEVARHDFGFLSDPFLPVVVWLAGVRSGTNFTRCDPVDFIARIAPRPILIMHCTGDEYVDFRHARRLYDAAKYPKELWEAPCTKHVQEWNQCRAQTERRVLAFFSRTLGATKGPSFSN